ncbi:hypothetical protein [Sulfurimonas sp. RIFOXYB12_FULL_35_9]|uniref:hypothetical protein n=1 Tax=Sulfurimonas sp. RIFOXYB12_FULL_35_9 TaxID=1802256 RepID=UPI0008D29AF2|nr:hypothetical protein [Sulfurimonas sp. RIFOXYB12_FULL_35_9]OHE05419.1 MAG: hypothetical protein A2345_01435 [Sulfurimonas sp. RIFOXYB12_FULL_35_9]
MKKLKNWFIGFKTIRGGAAGLINIADYIYNDKHKNHLKNGHEIVAFESGNSEKILQNILHIQQSKENETLLKRKGGRPASYGKSLLVSFPPEIKLSDEAYRLLKDKLVDKFIKFISDNNNLNYTPEQIAYTKRSFVISSVHKQKNSNDHLNIIIPNVFLDLNKNKSLKRVDLGKKMYSHFLKTITNSLLLNMGHNYLDYQIKRQRNNKNHKNKLSYTIEQLQEVFKEMDFLKDVSSKLEKRITIYMQRMQSAIDEKNEKKFETNLSLANISYNKLKELVDEQHMEKLAKFETLKKNIQENKQTNFSANYPAPKRY